jgi:hypothetical protein
MGGPVSSFRASDAFLLGPGGGGLNLWRDNDDVRRRQKTGYGDGWGHVR